MVPWIQLVFMPVTSSVTWPPCGTLLGVTLVMAALDGVTVKVNGKIVAWPARTAGEVRGDAAHIGILRDRNGHGDLLALITLTVGLDISPVKSAVITPPGHALE